MPKPNKRKRPCTSGSYAASGLQAGILSVFSDPWPILSQNRRKCPKRPGATQVQSSTLLHLIGELRCIAKDQAEIQLSQLKDAIVSGGTSPTEFAAYISAEDEADTVPPLCVLTQFLQDEYVRIRDVDHFRILQRAVYEISNVELCSCRGLHGGITTFLDCVLRGERGTGRDSLLNLFMSVLFQELPNESLRVEKKGRFLLAELTVRYMSSGEVMGSEERTSLLLNWIKQCASPKKAVREEDTEDTSKCWTAELSGLATGRSPVDYLGHADVEERALLALFCGVSAAQASQCFIQCLNNSVCCDSTDQGAWRCSSGAWSKLSLLGRRAVDKSLRSDIDGTEMKTIESAMLGAVCMSHVSSSSHSIAILLCLARVLFQFNCNENGGGETKEPRTALEQWFQDVVNAIDRIGLKSLVKVLMELAPLEPLPYLRLNYKTLSKKRDCLDLSRDYVVLARTRISDLEPLRPGVGSDALADKIARGPGEDQVSGKAVEDAIRSVKDFTDAKGIVPKSMIRQMNFHRYHFRTTTLRALLDPNLASSDILSKTRTLIDDKDAFDNHRIELIRTLAFTRRDQAVTKGEARKAIDAIQEALKTRRLRSRSDAALGEELLRDASQLDENSSFSAVMKVVLAVPGGSEKQHYGGNDEIPSVQPILLTKAHAAIQKCDGHVATAVLAQDILKGILDGLMHNLPDDICFSKGPDHSKLESCLGEEYRKWWRSSGIVLVDVILHVLGDEQLRILQKGIQCQLFAIICTRNQFLSGRELAAVAMLTCALCVGSNRSAIADLSFTTTTNRLAKSSPRLNHISMVMFDCLPIADPLSLWASASFAFHCFLLFDAAGLGAEELSYSSVPDGDLCVTSNQNQEALSYAISGAPLRDLLRWVLLNPWRLMAYRNDGVSACKEVRVNEAAVLLKLISVLCKSKVLPLCSGLSLKSWLSIEARCGWGRPNSIRILLHRYAYAGLSGCKILGESLLYVVNKNVTRAGFPNWIVQGLSHFADEKLFCQPLDSHDGPNDRLSPFVEICLDKHGPDVGCQMLELLAGMRQTCYFHNNSLADAYSHIRNFLMPACWPFSSRILRYLVDCMGRKCCQMRGSDTDQNVGALLISNIAQKWDSLEPVTYGERQSGNCPGSAFSQAQLLRCALLSLTSPEGQLEVRSTQRIMSEDNSVTTVAERFPQALGAGLVLHLASRCYNAGVCLSNEEISNTVDLLKMKVSELATADVLDVAIHVASFIPFAGPFAVDEVHETIMVATKKMLVMFLEVRLCLAGPSLPVWIGCPMQLSVRGEHELRPLSEFLGRVHSEIDDFEDPGRPMSLPGLLCLSRLLMTISLVSKQTLTCVLVQLGLRRAFSGLLSNILRVSNSLVGSSTDGSGVLPRKSREKLVSFRNLIHSKLMGLFCFIVRELENQKFAKIDKHLSKVLLEFPTLANEVRAILRSQDLHEPSAW